MESFADAVELEEWPSAISHLQSAAMAALRLSSWIIAQAPAASAAVEPSRNASVTTMTDTRVLLAELREIIGGFEDDDDKRDVRSRDPEEAQ